MAVYLNRIVSERYNDMAISYSEEKNAKPLFPMVLFWTECQTIYCVYKNLINTLTFMIQYNQE